MKKVKQLVRLIHINIILLRHGLDQILLATKLFAPFRFLIYLNPKYWFCHQTQPRGDRIRQALEELGPIFVKFGQNLSTRRDLLADDIVTALEQLTDRVPAFPSEQAHASIAKTYGRPTDEVFKHFDDTPIASASIAQVHAAQLPTGEEVVVKILRPQVKKAIKCDIALLRTFANLAERFWPDAKRFKPNAIVDEFESTLMDELDLLREAANASQLHRNFEGSNLLHVPKIYWDYSHHKIMVSERIYGISINNLAALKRHNINLKKLAERGVEIFFTQVFRDCFFHADMHPGNVFVSSQHTTDPQYMAVDFGIMGSLDPIDQRYLAENFLAFFNRDYRKVAQLHIESGWIPAQTSIVAFESAIRTVCEPIFERPLKDISFGQLLLRLFQVAQRFQMEIQPQLILLQKTLFNVEGLGRQLYPQLDLWTTAKPCLEKWLKTQVGMRSFIQNMRTAIPHWLEHLPQVPELLHQHLALSYQQRKLTKEPPLSSKQASAKTPWFKIALLTTAINAIISLGLLHLH